MSSRFLWFFLGYSILTAITLYTVNAYAPAYYDTVWYLVSIIGFLGGVFFGHLDG